MKRFTDTAKWEAPWFRKLSPNGKLFWFFITDRCDASGAWEVDYDAFKFYSGAKDNLKNILTEFEGRIVWINKDTLFIIKFIQFQYGELREDCKPHSQAWKALDKHNLTDEYLGGFKGFHSLSKDYKESVHSLKDKDKDKNKNKDKDEERQTMDFVVNMYHEILPTLRKVKGLGSARKRLILTRIRRCRKGEHMSDFRDIFTLVAQSPFLLGENTNGWQADFDWILKPKSWDNIIEGKYAPSGITTKVLSDGDHEEGF